MLKEVYENSLLNTTDTDSWVAEGNIKKECSPELGTILSNGDDVERGDHAHWTYWINQDFSKDLQIEWEFRPLSEPGLCMIFFNAQSESGESIFTPGLNKRDGYYPQYHSGDINTYHISYFRRKQQSERQFHTCNLRKSCGFHFLGQGADPLPDVSDAKKFYQLKIRKQGEKICFWIDDLLVFSILDNKFDAPLGGGKIGFRQMAPMKAAYRNLKVFEL